MTRKISNSEIQTFKDCRRKWYLSYYRGLEPEVEKHAGPLPLGIDVHEALQTHYDPNDGRHPMEVYNGLVAERMTLAPEQEASIREDADLGRAIIEGYLEWLEVEGADAHLEVIAPEEAVEIPLGEVRDQPVTIMGKLDVRVRNLHSGARQWMDHKTVGNMADLPKTAHMDEQFKLYSLLEYLKCERDGLEDEWADGGIINMLRKVKRTARAKPPFYDRMTVRYTPVVMRGMLNRVIGEIEEILRLTDRLDAGEPHEQVAYPSPSRDCTWKCQFFAVCPMMDETPEAAEEYLEDNFRVGDPYARYAAEGADKETG